MAEVRFIEKVLTPFNPKDRYYINYEELIKQYTVMILVGCVLILYFIVY